MSYDIFFVRRDPGQAFEDALADLEGSIESGEPLSDVDLELWDALLPLAREVLGDVEVDEEDVSSRQLVAPASGVEVSLVSGELEIHVPDDRAAGDDLELMSDVYELARAIEDVTGLEGYDPQLGEPVSDRDEEGQPTRRRWPDESPLDDDDDDDDDDGARTGTTASVTRPDMTPDWVAAGDGDGRRTRRWWEFWRS